MTDDFCDSFDLFVGPTGRSQLLKNPPSNVLLKQMLEYPLHTLKLVQSIEEQD
jgi:hypothetical protein